MVRTRRLERVIRCRTLAQVRRGGGGGGELLPHELTPSKVRNSRYDGLWMTLHDSRPIDGAGVVDHDVRGCPDCGAPGGVPCRRCGSGLDNDAPIPADERRDEPARLAGGGSSVTEDALCWC